jgi:site-specific DNA recombinase
MNAPAKKLRCAIYTRKSSEEGLEQDFNSLHAQREACEAYIQSQRAEGWDLVADRYDDAGISGGTLERPALKRLLADIEAGQIDIVVCYKIDRLSRSLTDFARLVDIFEQHGVTFVSITQQFNTTTSMGRLTLNILLSFAQFERELAGERIRDKFAASRKRGMWMGGHPPLGYDVRERKLVVNAAEAKLVRRIFKRLLSLGSVTRLVRELNAEGQRTKRGKRFSKGVVYKMLRNRAYIGDAVHKSISYPGEHEAIIDRHLFEQVQERLAGNARERANHARAQTPALLKGLIYGPTGAAMTPSHTRRRGREYRYYLTAEALHYGHEECPLRSVAAGEVEAAVLGEIRALLRAPEVVARTLKAVREEDEAIDDAEVVEALQALDSLWDELFPAEQARIVQLLVERVDVAPDRLIVSLRVDGLRSLVDELRGRQMAARRAA